FFDEGDDQELAQSIQSELTSNTDFKDRGVKQDDYYVLRKNEATSVLAELGFLSNEQDLEAIQDEEHMEQVTQSITNGLEDYFQLIKKTRPSVMRLVFLLSLNTF